MAYVRATQFLAALSEVDFILRLKFLREKDDDWVLEDKFDPVRAERKKGQEVIEDSRDTKPRVLTGIDSVFFQNACPVTAVAYGLNPFRDPDPANLAPMNNGDLKCMAKRVVDHFKGALRGQGLTPTPTRQQSKQKWEERVHESGATVERTHLTLVTSRSPTSSMPEPASWPWPLAYVRATQLLAALS